MDSNYESIIEKVNNLQLEINNSIKDLDSVKCTSYYEYNNCIDKIHNLRRLLYTIESCLLKLRNMERKL